METGDKAGAQKTIKLAMTITNNMSENFLRIFALISIAGVFAAYLTNE